VIKNRFLALPLPLALVAAVVFADGFLLRLSAITCLGLTAIGYAVWLACRGEWTDDDRPAAAPDQRQAELVTARIGEPTHAVARFVLHKQHGADHRWQGEEQLWIAVGDTSVWLLHRTRGRKVGGVRSRFARAGLHSRWTDHRAFSYHLGELSWPADPWFIAGELHGPRGQRHRLIGLLAGDELGVRELVTRTRSPSRAGSDDDHDTAM
jgi:hypothetical protein